jgi:hypothetical protein
MKKTFKVMESILMYSAGLMAGFAIMYAFEFLVMGITVTYPWWPIELLLGSAVAVFSAYELNKKSKELED